MHPLHTLPIEELLEVKDAHGIVMFGDDGYCYETKSLCECGMESSLPCTLVRDVMHGRL